jgi:putative membrane protein
MSYEWVKVLHLLSVISWMAGLLYLPRLMVYHSSAALDGRLSGTLKVMERRLLKAIMTPAMVASWVFGVWLAAMQGLWVELPVWFLLKLCCLVILTSTHIWLARQVRRFAIDANQHSGRTFRIVNEVPTVLMVLIVILVVTRPFL